MPYSSDFELKKKFRNLYPEYASRLDAATADTFDETYEQIIAEAKENLQKALMAAGVSAENAANADQTCCIPLSNEIYLKIIDARGDDLKNQLHVLLDGLERLKGMEKDDAGLVTAQILLSGALGVGLLSTSTVVAKLVSRAAEAVAAYAGVSAATVGVVCAIVALVIVAVLIPIIYFMEKPANCIVLLINETDQNLVFDSDYNVHGKPRLMTTPIPKGVVIPGVATYPVAGFIATEKRSKALIGTQYGFTMDYGNTGTKLSFGVECPLTSIYKDNNCYCAFNVSAQNAAEKTDELNKQESYAELNGLKLSIICNSGSGSIAYYVARVYRENQ